MTPMPPQTFDHRRFSRHLARAVQRANRRAVSVRACPTSPNLTEREYADGSRICTNDLTQFPMGGRPSLYGPS